MLEDIPADEPLQSGEHIDYGAVFDTISMWTIEHLGWPAEAREGSREVAAFDTGPCIVSWRFLGRKPMVESHTEARACTQGTEVGEDVGD